MLKGCDCGPPAIHPSDFTAEWPQV